MTSDNNKLKPLYTDIQFGILKTQDRHASRSCMKIKHNRVPSNHLYIHLP